MSKTAGVGDKDLMTKALSRPDLLPEQFISWLKRFVVLYSSDGSTQSHDSYVPIWTSDGTAPSVGDGSLTGMYQRVGEGILYSFQLFFGSSTSEGTGNWFFSLPVPLPAGPPPLAFHIGSSLYLNGSTQGVGATQTNLDVGDGVIQVADSSGAGMGAGIPASWVPGDFVRASGWYPLT